MVWGEICGLGVEEVAGEWGRGGRLVGWLACVGGERCCWGGGGGVFEVADGFDVAWWALGKGTGGKREARLGGVSGVLRLASRLLLHHEGQILLYQAVWCIFCAGSFCVMTDGFGLLE